MAVNLILASTSPIVPNCSPKLRLPFVQVDPEYPEHTADGETPAAMCQRLARSKAAAVADRNPVRPG
ncbi:MAG: hypothetical protein U5O39_17520 [Gammaproteobacteria bacterium]|nr:hypothetical protein [Gammaproteobacteria bacterium]